MDNIILQPKILLSTANPKTAKSVKLGYLTSVLHLLPSDLSGKNVCSHASEGYKKACLNKSGRGGFLNTVHQARLRKTRYFQFMRKLFFEQLKHEIRYAVFRAERHGLVPCFRLNGTSDIPWETYRVFNGKNIFEVFPDVQFYDYTKNPLRFNKPLPKNYYLLFSRDETNETQCKELLKRGVNVAVVFEKVLPKKYLGVKVISGDVSDLRFLDTGCGVVVGLKFKRITAKGGNEINKHALESGFVVRPNQKKVKKNCPAMV